MKCCSLKSQSAPLPGSSISRNRDPVGAVLRRGGESCDLILCWTLGSSCGQRDLGRGGGGINIWISSDKQDRDFSSAEQVPMAESICRLSSTGGVSLSEIQPW